MFASLQAAVTPTLQYVPYRAVHYQTERHLVSLIQDQSLNTKIVSSLDVRATTSPMPCGQEQDVFITYTIAGEEEGEMDLIYLVGGLQDTPTLCSNPASHHSVFTRGGKCRVNLISTGVIQRKHHPSGG